MKDPLIDKLEAEIRYLKKLLDENGIQYDYQAYVDGAPVQRGEVQFPELTPEHAIQFYSYFRGRKDVYVKRSSKKDIIRSVTISGNMVSARKLEERESSARSVLQRIIRN